MSRAYKLARHMSEMERISQNVLDAKTKLAQRGLSPDDRERASRTLLIEESLLDHETDKYLKLVAKEAQP